MRDFANIGPNPEDQNHVETDERFPSGPWIGFFLQREIPGKHRMDLTLTFKDGLVDGFGRDWVGKFRFVGRYQVDDGRCFLTKQYLGSHQVQYIGYNEGRGIWGTWEIPGYSKGGFRIWPEGMPDPDGCELRTEVDLPVEPDPRIVEEWDDVVPAMETP